MTETTTTRRPRKMTRAAAPKVPNAGTIESHNVVVPATTTALTVPKPPSKAAEVLALLQRPEGPSLAELVGATGWLPHTTRAALTGLRKKGHAITRDKVDGVTRYAIVAAPAVPAEPATPAAPAATPE